MGSVSETIHMSAQRLHGGRSGRAGESVIHTVLYSTLNIVVRLQMDEW